MIWPDSIAPFHVHLICVNPKAEEQYALAQKLYEELQGQGIEVLFDDRKASAGIKFKDADLIGIPHRIIVGRAAAQERVEYVKRSATDKKEEISAERVLELVRS
jgi:prolyl-tRNA synthetase